MRLLITGGAGFLGHHCVEHLLKNTDAELVVLDRIDTSSNMNRLSAIGCWEQERSRVTVLFHDLRAAIPSSLAWQLGSVHQIWHLAAWSDVARSLVNPVGCVQDNVLGTVHLLEWARTQTRLERFLYCSTDEVFGPKRTGASGADDPYRSSTPYAASKAGGEELCIAYHNCYQLPLLVTHCMNIFGERQHTEKFIPMTIRKILRGEPVQIHADLTTPKEDEPGRLNYIIGSRCYLHARTVADAMLFLVAQGAVGEKYNIVGEHDVSNLALASLIASMLERQLTYNIVDGRTARPGHDLRYALDGAKLAALGWTPPVHFTDALERTVRYSVAHPEWLSPHTAEKEAVCQPQ